MSVPFRADRDDSTLMTPEFLCTLTEGKFVRVIYSSNRKRGRYGRLLAYLFIKGRDGKEIDISRQIAITGHGKVDLRFPHDRLEEFRELKKTP